MARDLLIRGMIAGVIAAILVTLFARFFAEPQVDLSIAFEGARAHAMHAAEEPELVSRATQKGIGLLTAVLLYGAAVGGIFSLVFAGLYGRVAMIGPRSLAGLLAIAAFVAIVLVPALKYPPTPPAIGHPETIGFRTFVYFGMIGLSVVALIVSLKIGRALRTRFGAFNALLAAGGCYVAIIAAVEFSLPVIDEVPQGFPATLLWDFRIVSIGIQAILWAAIGIGFGVMAEQLLRRRSGQLQ